MILFWGILSASYLVTTASGACSHCAYRGCHPTDPSKLNVHLIAHTHDDAGWLKTADQYFYGGNLKEAEGGVQYIIDSVLGELDADDNRRFILAEPVFLWRWWNERSEHLRHKMKKFIEAGRLQLVNGGWVMADEATPHYTMLIDQMSLGIRFLTEIFGECGLPKIGWQIDPFGHSSEMGQIFIDMGFDAVFFGRINQDEYLLRREKKEMEMVWQPYSKGGTLFTGILYNLYQPPDGFCFDVTCRDEPIMDNPRLHGYNAENRISHFVDYARLWANSYQSNHVALTMGGDFHYMVASRWFVNLDKIIKNVNGHYNDVNVLYSTPACYLKALNEANLTWPIKEDEDFFPYSSYEKRYWTGYYTSRPNLKYFIARVNNILQVVKKMAVYSSDWNSFDEFEIERAVALAQHHDAISGTQRQHVAEDYALYLHEAVVRSKNTLTNCYRSWGEDIEPRHSYCLMRNISECFTTEQNRRLIVYIFNPLSVFTNVTVRFPVMEDLIEVHEAPGSMIAGDLMPVPHPVRLIPGRRSSAKMEYVFQATDVPPMGYKTLYVQQFNPTEVFTHEQYMDGDTDDLYPSPSPSPALNLGFEENFQIVMNSTTGRIQYLIIDGQTRFLEQNFGFYTGEQRWYSSGAYTFAPSHEGLVEYTQPANVTIHRGRNVIEIHQVFDTWLSQVIRLYRGKKSLEFEWLVGPIPLRDVVSKEIITIYKTQLETAGIFYTDSNGRKFIKRRQNHRGKVRTFSSGIEANYYPVTTAAKIQDNQATLTVLTDRAQGASSNIDGSLEFMIHRRLLVDDGKGVTEPLNEKAFGVGLVTRGTHVVQFFENREAAYHHRHKTLEITQGPWVSFTPAAQPLTHWEPKEVTFLWSALPENIHILTLQKMSPAAVLLRLEHIFDIDEDERFSLPTEVDISVIFPRKIKNVREVSLDGQADKECLREKFVWRYSHQNKTVLERPRRTTYPIVTLKPMEIRTFIVTFS